MTSRKNDSRHSFTSLRIIGEKAQKLLQRARDIREERTPDDGGRTVAPGGDEHQEVIVHLSIRSVVKAAFAVLAIIAGAMLMRYLQDVIVLLLLSIFVAMIIDPGVQFMHRLGVPRGLAVLLHYFVAIFLIVFLIVSLVPILARQLIDLAQFISAEANAFLREPRIALPFIGDAANENITELLTSTLQQLSINRFADALQQFGQSLSTAAQSSLILAAHLAGSVVNFFANFILILVIGFFLQIEKEKIIAWIRGFLPWSLRPYVDDKTEAIQTKMAQWTRGQLLLCLFIGLMVFLALTILRMPYALTLGILAGFTEFVPVIGPLIAAIPAVIIAFTQDGILWALIIAAVYYVIQWCENNLLVPLIMKRAVGLSPIAVIFAMLVGVSFPNVIHPVLGIILSIPTTTIIALFLEDWRAHRALAERK